VTRVVSPDNTLPSLTRSFQRTGSERYSQQKPLQQQAWCASDFQLINSDKVKPIVITELLGDGIGPELAESVHAVAESLPAEFKFIPVDWSLENREARGDDVIDEAENSMRETKLAVKYPTVTRKRSPNALIRRRCDFSVIYRPAISIKGIHSNFKEDVNLHGTYDDPGQLIGSDAAVSLRMVERKPCMQAAKFAFDLARRKGALYSDGNYSVTSSSKHTIQRVTDGLFESVVAEVAETWNYLMRCLPR